MILDSHNWSPLSVEEIAEVFEDMPVAWWIAGGWALDLFAGRTTRAHEDIDILILRRDQLAVQKHLSDWQLFKTKQPHPPHLALWPEGEFLEPPINDVWVRRNLHDGPWNLQLMLMEAEGDRWNRSSSSTSRRLWSMPCFSTTQQPSPRWASFWISTGRA